MRRDASSAGDGSLFFHANLRLSVLGMVQERKAPLCLPLQAQEDFPDPILLKEPNQP